MKSILQDERECYFCKNPRVECHHIFGAANRGLSEQLGLKVWLCPTCHRRVHEGRGEMDYLHKIGEKAFIAKYGYTEDDFRRIFGRNYL